MSRHIGGLDNYLSAPYDFDTELPGELYDLYDEECGDFEVGAATTQVDAETDLVYKLALRAGESPRTIHELIARLEMSGVPRTEAERRVRELVDSGSLQLVKG